MVGMSGLKSEFKMKSIGAMIEAARQVLGFIGAAQLPGT